MLIDTGAAKNYIKPVKELKNVMPVASPFSVSAIHGSTKIKQKCFMKVFNYEGILPHKKLSPSTLRSPTQFVR